ncbi:MAG: LamG domain-containing protein [Pirellulaceae bacterium]|nr:LamG domain-containing protein [Pirellulaceae bacterium]
MQLPRYILMPVALSVLLLAAEPATAETVFAYYAFDTETSGATPDGVGDNDLTLGSSTGDSATIDSASMFGAGALKSTQVAGYAQLADGDPEFDTTYTKLSVSLWANQAGGWTGTFGNRYLTGKYSTGDNRGWALSVKGGSVNQIVFDGFESNLQTDPNLTATTTMSSALAEDEFHHIVATFDASGTSREAQFKIYVDGIRQENLAFTSKLSTVPNTIDAINGDNSNPFQVINRGNTAAHSTSGGGFIGSIDDYLIATGDVLTDQQVALIHGLGRLAGVSYESGATPGVELAGVLGAYNAQGSAMAGGAWWTYGANVGSGPIGTIGGTVAGGDAYIVLGADGSGVTFVPEPGTFALLLAGLAGLLAWRRR